MEVGNGGVGVRRAAPTALILLDTNALIWLYKGHRRGGPLARFGRRLYVSPATLLELQLLTEVGRLRLRAGANVTQLADDDRWLMDDPPAAAWFERALATVWTRDLFDRLLVAHAQLRGWRLATGDSAIAGRLGPGGCVEL